MRDNGGSGSTGVAAGDDGFEAFYTATAGRLVGQVYAIAGNLHDAEDAVQEALARASVRWEQIRGYDRPEAWLMMKPLGPMIRALAAISRSRARARPHGLPADQGAPARES